MFKNNRKVNPITYKYIDIEEALTSDYNYSLFCINTGALKYSDVNLMKAKIVMEYNFPEPTRYEIINYKNIPNLAFNIISQMDKKEDKLSLKFVISCIIIAILILIIFIMICIKKKRNIEYRSIPKQIELIKEKKKQLFFFKYGNG